MSLCRLLFLCLSVFCVFVSLCFVSCLSVSVSVSVSVSFCFRRIDFIQGNAEGMLVCSKSSLCVVLLLITSLSSVSVCVCLGETILSRTVWVACIIGQV